MNQKNENDDLNRWQALAASGWDYSAEQQWFHLAILYPAITDIIEDEAPSSILDFGCGRGHLSDHLRSRGFAPDLYDPVAGMASAASDGRFFSDLANAPRDAYECIVANLVLSVVGDLQAVLRAIYRLLAHSGLVICSVPHPVFALLDDLHTTTQRKWNSGPRHAPLDGLARYFAEDSQDVVWCKDDSVSTLYHRTVSTYMAAFRGQSFEVARISEPRPVHTEPAEEHLSERFSTVPAFMIFCLRKAG